MNIGRACSLFMLLAVCLVPAPTFAQAVAAATTVQADSEEMKAIFLADQFDRGNNPYAKKGEAQPKGLPGFEVRKNDDAREARVKALLDEGVIRTGTDFYRAALVFQHSGNADGQLLAHVLASVAATKGCGGALWLMAATLDRYLDVTGKKQIFGTQFHSVPESSRPGGYSFVQGDIESGVVSDALRAEFCVRHLKEQGNGLPGPPESTGLVPCPARDNLQTSTTQQAGR